MRPDATQRLETILLVAGDPDLRHHLLPVLHRGGYEVAVAANRRGALASLAEVPPDLVLISISGAAAMDLPLVGDLRQDPILRETPLLLLADPADRPAAVAALARGADDYLLLPLD